MLDKKIFKKTWKFFRPNQTGFFREKNFGHKNIYQANKEIFRTMFEHINTYTYTLLQIYWFTTIHTVTPTNTNT
jgi:hypothetical protein